MREHLVAAEKAGWLKIESAGFTGPQHARKQYVARWPDSQCEDVDSGEIEGSAITTAGETDPRTWGDVPPLDGVQCPTYKTSPLTSPNTTPEKNADASADGVMDKVRIRRDFLRWLPTFPGYEQFSDATARKEWFSLSDAERRACVRLTPAFLRWLGKGKPSSPAHYLRDRAWEGLPADAAHTPELIDAKSFSPLWMATRFAMLLQPPTGVIVLTAFDKNRPDKTEAEVRREKLIVHGWPNVNAMMADMRRGRPHKCPTALLPLSKEFKAVRKADDLYGAWGRLHQQRGWPFFDFAPDFVPFPAADLGVTNQDAAVEAALAELEAQISKV